MPREFEGPSPEEMGLTSEQMGIKKEFRAGGGSAESSPEQKLSREMQGWTEELQSGKFETDPVRYFDRGLVIDIRDENGREVGNAFVSRDYQRAGSTVTEVDGYNFHELDVQGRPAKWTRFDKTGKLKGSTEFEYTQLSMPSSTTVDRDPQGQVVRREWRDDRQNKFTVEYYDEANQLAGVSVDTFDPVLKGVSRSHESFDSSGNKVKAGLDEHEWFKKMSALVGRRSY